MSDFEFEDFEDSTGPLSDVPGLLDRSSRGFGARGISSRGRSRESSSPTMPVYPLSSIRRPGDSSSSSAQRLRRNRNIDDPSVSRPRSFDSDHDFGSGSDDFGLSLPLSETDSELLEGEGFEAGIDEHFGEDSVSFEEPPFGPRYGLPNFGGSPGPSGPGGRPAGSPLGLAARLHGLGVASDSDLSDHDGIGTASQSETGRDTESEGELTQVEGPPSGLDSADNYDEDDGEDTVADEEEPEDIPLPPSLPLVKEEKLREAWPLGMDSFSIFVCPITHEVLRDPVVCADGHTYERSAIARWFLSSRKSPITGQNLPHSSLFPNHALRTLMKGLCDMIGTEENLAKNVKAAASEKTSALPQSPPSQLDSGRPSPSQDDRPRSSRPDDRPKSSPTPDARQVTTAPSCVSDARQVPRTATPNLMPETTLPSTVTLHSLMAKGLPERPPGSAASTERPPITASAASTSVSSSSDSWPAMDAQSSSSELPMAPPLPALTPSSSTAPAFSGASEVLPQSLQPRLGLQQQEPRSHRGAGSLRNMPQYFQVPPGPCPSGGTPVTHHSSPPPVQTEPGQMGEAPRFEVEAAAGKVPYRR